MTLVTLVTQLGYTLVLYLLTSLKRPTGSPRSGNQSDTLLWFQGYFAMLCSSCSFCYFCTCDVVHYTCMRVTIKRKCSLQSSKRSTCVATGGWV